MSWVDQVGCCQTYYVVRDVLELLVLLPTCQAMECQGCGAVSSLST